MCPVDLSPSAFACLSRHPLSEMARLDEHEAIIEQREGLWSGDALIPPVDAYRRIGAVERRHEWLHLRTHDEAVDRTPPGSRAVRIKQAVLIVGRMLRPLDDEILPSRSAHLQIELPAYREHSIPDRFCLELPT